MQKINFIKMHGAGNDYIFIDCLNQNISLTKENIKIICDRHFGIGGDGVVFIQKSKHADAKMQMFNADGSPGETCGNALRCIAKYLAENFIEKKCKIKIETSNYISEIIVDKEKSLFTVDMGVPDFSVKNIPILINEQKIINYPFVFDDTLFYINCLKLCNPHCVIFVKNFDFNLARVGSIIENHEIFPNRINVSFAKVSDSKNILLNVWERGSGITLACGSAACATTAVACELGFTKKNEKINIVMQGGDLGVIYNNNNHLFLIGDAKITFKGVYLNDK